MFILAIILVVLAVIVYVCKAFTADDFTKKIVKRCAYGTLALALLFVFFSSIATVGTKDVGILTAFGRTEGHLSNGFHLKAPWENVTSMDAAIQTDTYGKSVGAGSIGTTLGDCINVRIANQQTGCANITIQWRIRPGAADVLYQNYRTFDHVRDALVTKEFQAAINNQLTSYNPLNSIAYGTPAQGVTPNLKLSDYAANIQKQMAQEIGDRIEVLHVFLPLISFDPETQNRLNQLQQQIAQTRIAEQQVLTNQAQSKANQALAKSVNTSPNVLVSECMSALAIMAKANSVPVGFSCWPGGSSVSSVIANTTPTVGK